MAETTSKATPRDLLRAVLRRRLMFLVGAAIFGFAALVGAWLWWPLKYTATAKLERRLDAASEDLTRSKSASFEALKRTLQNDLAGPNAMGAAVEELEKRGLIRPLPRSPQDAKLTPEGQMVKQQLVRDLTDDLRVTFDVSTPEVDLVTVSFTDADPRLAQALPNTLVTSYISRISSAIIDNLTLSRDFLEGRAKDAGKRLDDLTRERVDFEAKHAGMLPDNPGALVEQIQRNLAETDTVRRQLALAKEKLDQVKAVRGGSPEAGGPPSAPERGKDEAKTEPNDSDQAKTPAQPPAASGPSLELDYRDALQELARLQVQQQEYQRARDEGKTLSHMTDKHPRIVALKKQIDEVGERVKDVRVRIAQLETQIKETQGATARVGERPGDEAISPLLARQVGLQEAQLAINEASAKADVDYCTNELKRREDRQKSLEDSFNNFGPVRQKYLEITKKVADQQAELDRWQKRWTEVQMDLQAEAAKYRTRLTQVVLAEEQFAPSSPKLLYVLGLALAGGLAFGGGLVFLANTMDRSLTTTEEAAAHFGLPVFGVVGEIETPRQKRMRRLLRWSLGPALTVIAVLALGLATLNIVLWLQYRDEYKAWKRAPASYVARNVEEQLGKLRNVP